MNYFYLFILLLIFNLFNSLIWEELFNEAYIVVLIVNEYLLGKIWTVHPGSPATLCTTVDALWCVGIVAGSEGIWGIQRIRCLIVINRQAEGQFLFWLLGDFSYL